MIKFIQSTPESRDCTCGYVVELDKEYTVREFIELVVTERQKEWGSVSVHSDTKIFGIQVCEYKHGIVTVVDNNEFMDRKIESITAQGGWSNMDYTLLLVA